MLYICNTTTSVDKSSLGIWTYEKVATENKRNVVALKGCIGTSPLLLPKG